MVRPYAVFANPPGDDEIFVILFENFKNVCQGTFELCISMFFDVETRSDYLSFGIPYKNVCFLYGVPGSGKTSLIDALASEFSCDIYMLPITGDADDIA